MIVQVGRQISFRRTILLVADVLAVVFSLILSAMIRWSPMEGLEWFADHISTTLACACVVVVIFYAGGMYERTALTRSEGSYVLPFVTVSISLVTIIILFYAQLKLDIGRGLLGITGALIFMFTWLTRYAYRYAVGKGLLSKTTLAVGEGRELEDVIRLIASTPDSGYRLAGCVTIKRNAPDTFVAGIPVVGTFDRIHDLVKVFDVECIVVATAMSREPALLRLLRPLRFGGAEIMDYVTLHEQLAQEIPLNHINDEWLMNATMNSSVIHIRKIKRIMDSVSAIVGLVLSSPIMLITAFIVRLDSPGPILYRQKRLGLDGTVFTLYKFRTMRADAEARSGAVWAGSRDARVTRSGKLLRSWRLDEIPQLINVLRGEMSLVGPRPERPEFVETLDAAIPFYKERLLVQPGITGWAQVKYPYAASIDAARRKLQYDLYYIKHMSFSLDGLILLRTFKTIIIGLTHSEEGKAPTEKAPPAPQARSA